MASLARRTPRHAWPWQRWHLHWWHVRRTTPGWSYQLCRCGARRAHRISTRATLADRDDQWVATGRWSPASRRTARARGEPMPPSRPQPAQAPQTQAMPRQPPPPAPGRPRR